MAAALLCLAVLYLPLPVAVVMFVLGWTGSWLLAVAAMAALFAFLLFLPSLSERVALASTGAREVSAQEEPGLHALVARLAAMADCPRLASPSGRRRSRTLSRPAALRGMRWSSSRAASSAD